MMLCLGTCAVAGEVNRDVASFFQQWNMSLPSTGRIVVCHGFGCTFRTEIALSAGDRGRMTDLMAAGMASAIAERGAIGKTEAWFEKRVAPQAGTTTRVARAGVLLGKGRDPGQFDCIDTTTNTNSLLLVLDQLGLLRHHVIAAPRSRLLINEGPHYTATIKDKRTGRDWTVDPWTHQGSEVPDIWPVEKWAVGG
jgi:hypothetical protein